MNGKIKGTKAFDKVPHKRLIKKLDGYGIQGNILRWIAERLEGDRKQLLQLNGHIQGCTEVRSGVRKGLFWDHFFLQSLLMIWMKRYFVMVKK